MAQDDDDGAVHPRTISSGYSKYILFLLVLVSFLNYIDRQVIYIVGERVKQNLRLDDAELGFLMGTSFAVFYGVSGIAMGRIADAVSRTKLLALALALWSGLTALSGAAANFAVLAFARVGVGIGESAASPCSQALIAESFPPRNRATAFSIYVVGVQLGGAASLLMGALVLQHWTTWCAALPGDACAVADWRAAFFAVGLPGLAVAGLIYRLREPPRPKPADDVPLPRLAYREMSAAVPPFTLGNLWAIGGRPAVLQNLGLTAVLLLSVCALILATGDTAQWVAVGIGAYSIVTWGQVMKLRDRALFDRTFGGRAFAPIMFAGALLAVCTASVGAWSAPYAMRVLGAPPVTVGLYLGIGSALGGVAGAITGGRLTDWWRSRDSRAPVWVGMMALVAPLPFLALMLQAHSLLGFALASLLFHFFGSLWTGVAGALAQDLVLPRMRGAAAGAFSLVMIVIASGFGPYIVGKISHLTGSLATGMLSVFAVVPIAIGLFLLAAARLPSELARQATDD